MQLRYEEMAILKTPNEENEQTTEIVLILKQEGNTYNIYLNVKAYTDKPSAILDMIAYNSVVLYRSANKKDAERVFEETLNSFNNKKEDDEDGE